MANKRNKRQQEEDTYTIERIVGKRVNNETGSVEYLVHWEGYDESDDTWENGEMLVSGLAGVFM